MDIKRVYNLNEGSVADEYSGCGHGWIKIERATGVVAGMSYSLDPDLIDLDPNTDVRVCSDFSVFKPLVVKKDDWHLWVLADFSCYQAITYLKP